MENCRYYDICNKLLRLIPKEEIDNNIERMSSFGIDFIGFIEPYYYLSLMIPKDYTIIDFGAAYNAQSYFFKEHSKYIAIEPDNIEEDSGMFCPPNCEIYRMTTKEFLDNIDYPKDKVFAICNYVPNWYEQNSIDLVKKSFQNCYTFYPCILK